MLKLSLLAAGLAAVLGACASDDSGSNTPVPPAPTTFKLRIENIAPWTVLKSGTQAMKVDGTTGAAGPGAGFDIPFTAGKNQKVSFVAMFGQSNDWFFGPGPEGIALYNADGTPRSGDVTSEVSLWDAGTEIDQEPGVGDATGPKQPTPDFGAADPNPMVRQLGATVPLTAGGSFHLPALPSMIKVTLVPGANRTFTLQIRNVSTATTLQTSAGASGIGISPVVWAVHIADAPFFALGTPDRKQGLELVAESGRGLDLGSSIRALSGWPTPVSPGVFAVHQDPEPLYALGLEDLGLGLENIAESGNVATLAAAIAGNAQLMRLSANGVYNTPVGASGPGPAKPGQAFELTVSGVPGDHVSFASMFGMSNDWIFATHPEGIALFDGQDRPITGDVTQNIGIYDVGTEVDQEPAIGPDTGPQQVMPTDGAIDPVRIVREVPPSIYGVPATTHLRVTLTPVEGA